MKVKRRQWTLKDYHAYFRSGLIVLQDILASDFVRFFIYYIVFCVLVSCKVIDNSNSMLQLFAPIMHKDHWWCYVVNCQEKKLFVLDSIGHSNKIVKE